jgi:hypothetical protein
MAGGVASYDFLVSGFRFQVSGKRIAIVGVLECWIAEVMKKQNR